MQDRPDLYAPIHKGLRHALNASLLRLGQLDPSDAADVADGLALLRDVLVWCEAHLDIEERFVHVAIERKRPGVLAQVRDEHAGHQRGFALLRDDADALERALGEPVEVQRARARQLYLSFSRFVGESFIHMAYEETEMNALLAELFSADEVRALLAAILASEPPGQLARSVRWTVPALDHTERAATIARARPSIDPALFDHLMAQLGSVLSERDHAKLVAALGRAA